MKILVPRPDDPEMERHWEDAKRACEAREQRQLSRALELAAELTADPDCCVGDRSRCRCAAKQLAVRDEPAELETADD